MIRPALSEYLVLFFLTFYIVIPIADCSVFISTAESDETFPRLIHVKGLNHSADSILRFRPLYPQPLGRLSEDSETVPYLTPLLRT